MYSSTRFFTFNVICFYSIVILLVLAGQLITGSSITYNNKEIILLPYCSSVTISPTSQRLSSNSLSLTITSPQDIWLRVSGQYQPLASYNSDATNLLKTYVYLSNSIGNPKALSSATILSSTSFSVQFTNLAANEHYGLFLFDGMSYFEQETSNTIRLIPLSYLSTQEFSTGTAAFDSFTPQYSYESSMGMFCMNPLTSLPSGYSSQLDNVKSNQITSTVLQSGKLQLTGKWNGQIFNHQISQFTEGGFNYELSNVMNVNFHPLSYTQLNIPVKLQRYLSAAFEQVNVLDHPSETTRTADPSELEYLFVGYSMNSFSYKVSTDPNAAPQWTQSVSDSYSLETDIPTLMTYPYYKAEFHELFTGNPLMTIIIRNGILTMSKDVLGTTSQECPTGSVRNEYQHFYLSSTYHYIAYSTIHAMYSFDYSSRNWKLNTQVDVSSSDGSVISNLTNFDNSLTQSSTGNLISVTLSDNVLQDYESFFTDHVIISKPDYRTSISSVGDLSILHVDDLGNSISGPLITQEDFRQELDFNPGFCNEPVGSRLGNQLSYFFSSSDYTIEQFPEYQKRLSYAAGVDFVNSSHIELKFSNHEYLSDFQVEIDESLLKYKEPKIEWLNFTIIPDLGTGGRNATVKIDSYNSGETFGDFTVELTCATQITILNRDSQVFSTIGKDQNITALFNISSDFDSCKSQTIVANCNVRISVSRQMLWSNNQKELNTTHPITIDYGYFIPRCQAKVNEPFIWVESILLESPYFYLNTQRSSISNNIIVTIKTNSSETLLIPSIAALVPNMENPFYSLMKYSEIMQQEYLILNFTIVGQNISRILTDRVENTFYSFNLNVSMLESNPCWTNKGKGGLFPFTFKVLYECTDEYTGIQCDIPKCFNISANDSSVCSNHGNCLDVNNCSCHFTYSGLNCETFNNVTIYNSSHIDNSTISNNETIGNTSYIDNTTTVANSTLNSTLFEGTQNLTESLVSNETIVTNLTSLSNYSVSNNDTNDNSTTFQNMTDSIHNLTNLENSTTFNSSENLNSTSQDNSTVSFNSSKNSNISITNSTCESLNDTISSNISNFTNETFTSNSSIGNDTNIDNSTSIVSNSSISSNWTAFNETKTEVKNGSIVLTDNSTLNGNHTLNDTIYINSTSSNTNDSSLSNETTSNHQNNDTSILGNFQNSTILNTTQNSTSLTLNSTVISSNSTDGKHNSSISLPSWPCDMSTPLSKQCSRNGKCNSSKSCTCNDAFGGLQCQFVISSPICSGTFITVEKIVSKNHSIILERYLMDTTCRKLIPLNSEMILENVLSQDLNTSEISKLYSVFVDSNGNEFISFDSSLLKNEMNHNSLILWRIDAKDSSISKIIIPINYGTHSELENSTFGLVKLVNIENGLVAITQKDNNSKFLILKIDLERNQSNLTNIYESESLIFSDLAIGNQIYNPSTNKSIFTILTDQIGNISQQLILIDMSSVEIQVKELSIPQTNQDTHMSIIVTNPITGEQFLLSSGKYETSISSIQPNIESENITLTLLASDSDFTVSQEDTIIVQQKIEENTSKIIVLNINTGVSLVISTNNLVSNSEIFSASIQKSLVQNPDIISTFEVNPLILSPSPKESISLSISSFSTQFIPVSSSIPIKIEGRLNIPGSQSFVLLKYEESIIETLLIQQNTVESFIVTKDVSNTLPFNISTLKTFSVKVFIFLDNEFLDAPIYIPTNQQLSMYRFEMESVSPKFGFFQSQLIIETSFIPPQSSATVYLKVSELSNIELSVPCKIFNFTFCAFEIPLIESSDSIVNVKLSITNLGLQTEYNSIHSFRYFDPSIVKIKDLTHFDRLIILNDIPHVNSEIKPVISIISNNLGTSLLFESNKTSPASCGNELIRQVVASSDLFNISNSISFDVKLSNFENIESGNLFEVWISKTSNATFFASLSIVESIQQLIIGQLNISQNEIFTQQSVNCQFQSDQSYLLTIRVQELQVVWELKNVELNLVECSLAYSKDNSKLFQNNQNMKGYQVAIGQSFKCNQLVSDKAVIPNLELSGMKEVCISCKVLNFLLADKETPINSLLGGLIGGVGGFILLLLTISSIICCVIRKKRKERYNYVYHGKMERNQTIQDLFAHSSHSSDENFDIIDETPSYYV